MKKGTIIKRTDYVATMLAIPVGEEHEFTLTGRDYASYMNAVSVNSCSSPTGIASIVAT